MNKKLKLIRITTVPQSLRGLLRGQLRYMSENGFEVIGVSSSGDALKEVEAKEGVRAVGIEMSRSITLLKDLKALFQLINLFRKEKPDIVHTHTPKAGLLGMMAAWIARVPHRLHTVAGMPLTVVTGLKRKVLNITEKVTYVCAHKVYPNSYGLQDIILENKFTSPTKLKVIGKGSSNGINTSEFDPEIVSLETRNTLRNELGIKPDDFMCLFVGRVVGDKGINELVESFVELYQNNPNAHLVIVGGLESHLDPIDELTSKRIEENPNIHAVGFKKNVIDYFASANLFVFPSYREGFPNVVMQAASMQLNCIVTDINGCNEIIKDGDNGWIVPVKDSISLYDRMQWCIANRVQSNTMGMQSRELMKTNYERSYVQGEILKEYRFLLGIRCSVFGTWD